MIRIWIWDFPLPPGLEILAQPWASALATLLFWLLGAVFLQFVVFGIVKALARRSETEVEDVIIDVSRRPLVLAIVLLGAVYSVDMLGLEGGFAQGLRRGLVAGLMAVATYWVWRMMKEVVLHYAEILARRSETRADDVLVPLVNQFAPWSSSRSVGRSFSSTWACVSTRCSSPSAARRSSWLSPCRTSCRTSSAACRFSSTRLSATAI